MAPGIVGVAMNLRIDLLSLVEHHGLSPAAGQRLRALADFGRQPPALRHYLPVGMAVLGAALTGLGLVLWVAVNWNVLPRAGRFGLLEACVAAALLGVWRFPVARMPLRCSASLPAAACLPFSARLTRPAPIPGNCLPCGPH